MLSGAGQKPLPTKQLGATAIGDPTTGSIVVCQGLVLYGSGDPARTAGAEA